MLIWNFHVLPEVRSAQFETKQSITKFNIVILTETQSPALFGRQLSGYIVFIIPTTSLGRAGEGVLSVRQQLPCTVSRLQTDQANSTIWLTLEPAQSRQQPPTLGACYTSPIILHSSAAGQVESLAAHVAQLSSNGNFLLTGDSHARVAWQLSPGSQTLVMMPLHSCRTETAPFTAMAASCCTCVRRLPWSSALAEPWGHLSSVHFQSVQQHCTFRALMDCGLFAAIQACGIGKPGLPIQQLEDWKK